MTQQEALDELRKLLKPGDTVQTILRHRARSGMTRAISPVFNGRDISYLVAPALGMRLNKNHGGITLSGCGMDMGFHLVHCLSREVFPDSFECIGKGCPSNDHFNGDRDYTPHRHSSGAYALQQAWL